MKKLISLFVISAFLFTLVPLPTAMANNDPPPPPNYAFVPNAEEASVSKVDLVSATEIARYSTVQPRDANLHSYDKYRVSRLTMDSKGNAWVLNTMTGRDYPQADAQGQVIRISANPVDGEDPGTNTSDSGGSAGMLNQDVRVKAFDVGEEGDAPRTISIVEEGDDLYLWIGFYLNESFAKYKYHDNGTPNNPSDDWLEKLETISVTPYNAYTAVIDGNGILWGVSRNASPYPSPSGTPGVFYFDTNDSNPDVIGLPYDLPGKSGENPYAILLKSDGKIWVSDGSNWGTNQARYFAVYDPTDLANPTYVNTEINSHAMRGFMEDTDGNIWATSINGLVIKLTWNGAAWSGATMISGLGELTGLGEDASGYFWVIRYGFNQMSRFDPAAPTPVGPSVTLGAGPYAYGDFVVPPAPPTYEICGYKYAEWEDEMIPLSGWEITLEKSNNNGFVATTTTGVDGKYCFTDLEEGEYKISEVIKDGWEIVSPVGNEYIVTLPYNGEPVEEPFYNFVNTPEKWCGEETAWAAQKHPGEERFVERGNWATYLTISSEDFGKLEGKETLSFPLYAGQHYLAGMLNVKLGDVGELKVQYNTYIPEGVLKHCLDRGGKVYGEEGFCGDWIGFLEYHLHVVDEFNDFNEVRTYNRRTGYGNPIPGQFKYKGSSDPAESETEWIKVDITGFSNEFFIAAHSVMQWCGYDCEALAEIEKWVPFDKVEVLSSGAVASSKVLEDGKNYLLVAKGTYRFANWGDAGIADAKFSLRPPGQWYSYHSEPLNTWVDGADLPNPHTNYLQIWINGSPVDWEGDLDLVDHRYTLEVVGGDSELNFKIMDDYYGDNSGSIWVTIFAWE